MFCPKCAAQNELAQAYCRQCGQPLSDVRLALEGRTSQSLEKLEAGEKWVHAGAVTLIVFTLIGLAIGIAGIFIGNPGLAYSAIINLLLGSAVGIPLIFAGKVNLKRADRLLSQSSQSDHKTLGEARQTDRLMDGGSERELASITEHTTLSLKRPETVRRKPE
jgi:hypothetical protein